MVADLYVAYTGGTIGMAETDHGLAPKSGLEGWLRELLGHSRFAGISWDFHEYPRLIDSTNATPGDWQAMADDVRQAADDHRGIVLLHGTDSMAYSSSALAFALADVSCPVVVTGAQAPYNRAYTDAPANVLGAVAAALRGPSGVGLFFDGKLFAGARATKVSTADFDGFDSPQVSPVGWVDADLGFHTTWLPKPATSVGSRPFAADADALVVHLSPGMSVERLERALTPSPRGVVLLGLGAGNAPDHDPRLVTLIQRLTADGCVVVMTSQCVKGVVNMRAYSVGNWLAEAGVVSAGDMTTEAAWTKLNYLLSQRLSVDEVRKLMEQNLAGELS